MYIEKTKKYIKWNPSHILEYINEHSHSSMGGGHMWRDSRSLDRAFWRWHYDTVCENVEKLEDSEGQNFQNDVFNGIRSRAQRYGDNLLSKLGVLPGPFKAETNLEIVRADWKTIMVRGRKDRDRMVRFDPSRSQVTPHVAQKAAWYKEGIEETIDIVDAYSSEMHFPLIEGGQIYVTAAELEAAGHKSERVDGKAWDTSVGEGLGWAFRPFLSYFHRPGDPRGFYFLDSGISPTTYFGTMWNIITNRDIDGVLLLHGDDITHYFTESDKSAAKPYVELDPIDTKYHYTLGVSYIIDPMEPCLVGLKTTMDRAGKMDPLMTYLSTDNSFEMFVKQPPHVHRASRYHYRRSRETRAALAGAYHGKFGRGTLIQALSKTLPGDWIAPTQHIEEMILAGEEPDPFGWAEEFNIAGLFTR
jgi:hypothetical protein